jgi:hypothetical protein
VWKFRTFSGLEITITEEQKNNLVRAMESGVKLVKVGLAFVAPSSIEYIISLEEEKYQKLKKNPILNDQEFKKWIETGETKFAQLLDARYPLPKYQQAWDEAKENKDILKSLTV